MTLGVLVSGRGSNLGAILDAIDEGVLVSRVGVVVSDVETAPALDRARRAGVPARFVPPGPSRARLTDEATESILSILGNAEVDVVCLAGFMRILGARFFEAYGGRILNIHPSLLPEYAGLEPQRRALEAGARESGCTVHVVTSRVDGGPVLAQAKVPVLPNDTVDTLSARILKEEHRLYVEVLRAIEEGRSIVPPSAKRA